MDEGMMEAQAAGAAVDAETLDRVRRVEMCAFRAWPALESAEYGGWVLRHSQGVTRRANSVFPNAAFPNIIGGEHLYDLDEAVGAVEEWYARRGARARYQLCAASLPAELDTRLGSVGYGVAARTGVHLAPVAGVLERMENLAMSNAAYRPTVTVHLLDLPNAAWWGCYAEGDELDAAGVTGRQAIVAGITRPASYALALIEGEPAGVGSAVADGEFAGLFNIATRPRFRRMGVGQAVMAALTQWSRDAGAGTLYLQVMDQNRPARSLYAALGFVPLYHYHYREQA